MRALIAEDTPDIRLILKKALEPFDYQILECEDGLAAWEAYQKWYPSLILLDWEMPRLNGLELCRKIQQSATRHPSFIIAISVYQNPEQIEAMLEAGADDYLFKPFELAVLTLRLRIAQKHLQMRLKSQRTREALKHSEKKYQAIFDNAAVGIIATDENGMIEAFNLSAEYIFGYTAQEVIGKNTELLIPHELRSKHQMGIQQYLKKGSPDVIGLAREVTAMRQNGMLFPLHLSLGVVKYKNQRRFIAVVRDLSKEKQAEQRLRESEERWQFALEGSGAGVWDWNLVSGEVFFSAHWWSMIGFQEGEFAAHWEEWWQRLHPEELPAIKALWQAHLEGKLPGFYAEYRLRCKDGSYKWMLGRGKVIQRLSDGNPARIVGTQTDIHDLYLLDLRLQESEGRFRQAFENAAIGMALVSPKGHWLKVNKALSQITGYAPEELLESTLELVYHPQDIHPEWFQLERLLRGEIEVAHRELRYLHKNGSLVWVAVSSSLIREESQRPLYFITQIRDITARKQAEQGLQQSEAKWRSLVDNAPDVIMIVNEEGRCLYMNRVVESWSSLQTSDFTGRLVYEYSPPQTHEMIRDKLYRAFHFRERGNYQIEMCNPAGVQEWYHTSFAPVIHQGDVESVILISRNISEQKQAEQELHQINERLLHMNQELKETQGQLVQAAKLVSLGEMATGIAHEINQPLQVISITAELGLMHMHSRSPERLRKDFENIVDQVQRANKIINHLRRFARQSNLGVLEMVDLNQVVQNALIFFMEQFRIHNIQIHSELSSTLPKLKGRSVPLEQVLVNLLSNARDAVINSVQPLIEVHTRQEGHEAVLEVCDTGSGIPAEILERIFDPFFTTKPVGQGTGLGLSISYGIIKEHGGRIEVQSKAQRGTCFMIFLPLPERSQ